MESEQMNIYLICSGEVDLYGILHTDHYRKQLLLQDLPIRRLLHNTEVVLHILHSA